MEIRCDKIVLRDMIESDIEDYVRWFTTETKWSDFDAPWEPVSGNEADERKSWTEYYTSVQNLPDTALRWKFEIEYDGRHIGWASSYMIDGNYDWISASDIKDGQTTYRAVGIDICESDVWGGGVGTSALRLLIGYYFDHGADAVYTQTWSGNARMIRCAEKLGFVECDRCVDEREIDGKKYDGLTFKLTK